MVEILAPKNLRPNSSGVEQPGEEDIKVARQEITDNAVVPRKRRHDEVPAGGVSGSVPKDGADNQETRKKRSAAVDSMRSGNQQMLRELILHAQ